MLLDFLSKIRSNIFYSSLLNIVNRQSNLEYNRTKRECVTNFMSKALEVKLVDYNRASLMKLNYAGCKITEQNIA